MSNERVLAGLRQLFEDPPDPDKFHICPVCRNTGYMASGIRSHITVRHPGEKAEAFLRDESAETKSK